MSADYDLDQSTLYDNLINYEIQSQEEIADFVKKAHLKLIVKRK